MAVFLQGAGGGAEANACIGSSEYFRSDVQHKNLKSFCLSLRDGSFPNLTESEFHPKLQGLGFGLENNVSCPGVLWGQSSSCYTYGYGMPGIMLSHWGAYDAEPGQIHPLGVRAHQKPLLEHTLIQWWIHDHEWKPLTSAECV